MNPCVVPPSRVVARGLAKVVDILGRRGEAAFDGGVEEPAVFLGEGVRDAAFRVGAHKIAVAVVAIDGRGGGARHAGGVVARTEAETLHGSECDPLESRVCGHNFSPPVSIRPF